MAIRDRVEGTRIDGSHSGRLRGRSHALGLVSDASILPERASPRHNIKESLWLGDFRHRRWRRVEMDLRVGPKLVARGELCHIAIRYTNSRMAS